MGGERGGGFLVFLGKGGKKGKGDGGGEAGFRWGGGGGGGDDQGGKGFPVHLNRYYDEVISHILDAESILLFGPGEAKGELEKRLASKGLGGRIIGVETTDKMTERQIAAKVRKHFRE